MRFGPRKDSSFAEKLIDSFYNGVGIQGVRTISDFVCPSGVAPFPLVGNDDPSIWSWSSVRNHTMFGLDFVATGLALPC
jgi:hypothetical protein